MPEASREANDGLAAASSSLRETAKWLVGGVAATSAGIFAGSSLTRLGSLNFIDHPMRLSLAVGGLCLGFAGLGFILRRALKVLTVEALSFRALIGTENGPAADIRHKLERTYEGTLPGGSKNFAELLVKLDAAWDSGDEDGQRLIRNFNAFLPGLIGEAGFLSVKWKFDRLVHALWIGGPLAIVGFGLFAWAANPPEDKAVSKPPLLQVNLP